MVFDDADDPENPTIDDLANEFERLWEEVEGNDDHLEMDDVFEEVDTRARDETIDTFKHIIEGECESDRCNTIRDALGIGSDDPEESNDESDTEDTDGEEDSQENDGGSDSGGDSAGSDGGGDDGGGSGDENEEIPWDDDTNIFGERVR